MSFKICAKKKGIICPKGGFIMQLKDLEKELEYCNYDLEFI